MLLEICQVIEANITDDVLSLSLAWCGWISQIWKLYHVLLRVQEMAAGAWSMRVYRQQNAECRNWNSVCVAWASMLSILCNFPFHLSIFLNGILFYSLFLFPSVLHEGVVSSPQQSSWTITLGKLPVVKWKNCNVMNCNAEINEE